MAGARILSSTRGRAGICQRCARAGARASQARWISQRVIEKRKNAERDWQEYASQIQSGTQKNLWDTLEERGFIKDVAGQRDLIRELMRQRRIGAYVGVDPTASSLHVGHLVPLMALFWMYMHGYGATTLVGGATAKIGDPTDRLKTRDKVNRATMTMNMTKIHYQMKKLWVNVDTQAQRYKHEKKWAWRRAVVNNNIWWNSYTLLEVLQRVGTSIRIGPMLSRDSVKRKMTQGDGVSFAEFTYPLMQGYDWYHMFRSTNVQMQIGGSDQYGNILSGIEVVKAARATEPDPAAALPCASELDDPVGFTVPLLTDSSGAKFGKSAGNPVWLDAFKTSPYDLYGYFMRRPDADVEKLLNLLTFLPSQAIREVMDEQNKDPSRRAAQHALAYEVVVLAHGLEVASQTRDEHRAVYGSRAEGAAAEPSGRPGEESGSSPSWTPPHTPEPGQPVTLNNAPRPDILLPESVVLGKSIGRILHAASLVNSVAEGHRLAMQQGAYIGAAPGQKAATNKGMLFGQLQFTPVKAWFPEDTKNFLIDGKLLILRKGKHNLRIVEMVSDDEYRASGQTYPGQPGTGSVRKLNEKLTALKEAADKGTATPRRPGEEQQLTSDNFFDQPDQPDGKPAMKFPQVPPRQTAKLLKKFERYT